MKVKPFIIEALKNGESYNSIAGRLLCSKATISYHAGKLGLGSSKGRRAGSDPANGSSILSPRIDRRLKYDWKEIQSYYDCGNTVGQCRDKFGFSKDAWTKALKRGEVKGRFQHLTADVIFSVRNTNRLSVKKALLRLGTKNCCAICKIESWMGKELSVQLDHIDGNTVNNKLENLRLLCPNCHSQTDTFAGRNKRYKGCPKGQKARE